MTTHYDLLVSLVLVCSFLLLLSAAAAEEKKTHEKCPPEHFRCGNLGEIHLPFTNTGRQECGLPVRGCENNNPSGDIEVQLGNQRWYTSNMIQQKGSSIFISIHDPEFENLLSSRNCRAFNYSVIPSDSPLMSFHIHNNITFFTCNHTYNGGKIPANMFHYTNCSDCGITIYYSSDSEHDPPPSNDMYQTCSPIQLPIRYGSPPSCSDPFKFLVSDFQIEVKLSHFCLDCYARGGQCLLDEENTTCAEADEEPPPASTHPCASPPISESSPNKAKIIGITIGCAGATLIALLVILVFYKQRHNFSGFQNQRRNIYAAPYSNTNPESRTVYFGVPVFSYEELQDATNNFDQARELGEGGFGTVYYGKLRDGREVAVKRLYERNYRPVESFINEIQILTQLRHKNLVTLYGCTSRHSRELLLVYDYIPNGTVGGHLHGDQAKPGLLPWQVRLKIAIQIASALTYLHASDIIHRDVKASNILLDNNFCVKVADFGLSRLFPNDVTHVSTAPQGTPGYVDPEYRHFYQLTTKSDVYSFGVVLIELISSMPAVDLTRNRDEIKLANLAMKKIQRREFCELVDPSLGFQSDNEVKRMITSVAELAFQCLQGDKELRPSMGEVLEMLQRIESGKDEPGNVEGVEFLGAGVSHINVYPSLPATLDVDEVRIKTNLKPQRPHQTL